jgi:succinate dehydrogenase / fumarate reductase flavoprotein subunit
MGGIPTNVHGQVVGTSKGHKDPVNGFYAVGECSCVSIHGANRLGTNSLLDLVVFGRAAGNHIVKHVKEIREHKPLPADAADFALARLDKLEKSSSGEYSQAIAGDIRSTMQSHAGVFRTEKLMAEGVSKIKEVAERVNHVHLKDKSKVFNTARVEALELANMIEVARATMVSAEARKESRGAHAPSEHTQRDDENWLRHTLWHSEDDRLDYKPVQLQPLTVATIPPKPRIF